MTSFQEDYLKAEEYLSKNNNEINLTKKFIQNILIPHIKNLQKHHPNITIEDFNSVLQDDALSLAKTSFESTYALDYYMIYIACKYLQKNPQKCKELYEDFDINNFEIDEKKFALSSNHNFEDYLTRFMYYVIPAYNNAIEAFKKTLELNPDLAYAIKKGKNSKELDSYIKSISSPIQKKQIIKYMHFYLDGIVTFLPDYESHIENEIKNTLSTSISEIAKQLSRLNLFEKYKDIEIRNYKKLGLTDLALAGQKFDLTSLELLKKLSIHELMILDSFWINRYAKELNSYCTGIFAIKNLDLLPKIFNDTITPSDIAPEHISETLIKCSMLKYHTQSYMNTMYSNYLSGDLSPNEYTAFEDENFIVYSFTPFGDLMKKRYGEEYDSFFDNLPGKTTIEDDSILYSKLISPVVNIYSTKDEVLNGLVYNLSNNSEIVNAGVIPDYVTEDGKEIFLNSNFICIGIDAKLTFPVTEHIKLSVLKDFLCTLQGDGNAFVPLYEGHNDFTYQDGKFIKAQQIFPTNKEFEKAVRKLNKESGSDLINHLAWNIKPNNIPDKFKASEVNSKGKTKKSYVRRFINLADYDPYMPLPIYIFKDDKYIRMKKSSYTFSTIDSIIPERR